MHGPLFPQQSNKPAIQMFVNYPLGIQLEGALKLASIPSRLLKNACCTRCGKMSRCQAREILRRTWKCTAVTKDGRNAADGSFFATCEIDLCKPEL
jgi:hypothetical protein